MLMTCYDPIVIQCAKNVILQFERAPIEFYDSFAIIEEVSNKVDFSSSKIA